MPTPFEMLPRLRSMPHDYDAERAALGSVVIKPAALDDIVTVIRADDFMMPAHVEIFAAMLEVWRTSRTVDPIALIDKLRADGNLRKLEEGEAYLLKLSGSVPTAENAMHYAQIVRDLATRRRMIMSAAEVMARAYDNEDVDEVLTDARGTFAVLDDYGSDAPERLGVLMPEAMDRLEKKVGSPEAYSVPVGLPEFDRRIGGYREGNLVIPAGRPGKGKTAWMAGTTWRSSVRGVPNLFISLEMTKWELIERFISPVAKVEVERLGRGSLEYADWKNGITPASKTIGELPIWIRDDITTLEEIDALIRRWRKEHEGKICKVAIDYLQLIRLNNERRINQAERIDIITRALKNLAKDLKIPIEAACQLNREVEKEGEEREPRLSDLRGSGSIEQDADMVIMMGHREYSSKGPVKAPVIVAKHRGGRVGILKNILWDGRYSTFFPDDDAEADEIRDQRLPGVD